jgi:hypothetical protein
VGIEKWRTSRLSPIFLNCHPLLIFVAYSPPAAKEYFACRQSDTKEEDMKKTLLFVCLLILCNLTLFAQTGTPRIVHAKENSSVHVPPQETPASLTKIYSNLGASKTDLYDGYVGAIMQGPNCGSNCQDTPDQYYAMQFIPSDDSHVSQVQVAVQYGSGTNQINLNIYGDTDGVPGTLLAGPVTVTNLPAFPSCCTLAIAKFSPIAVTAGTPYWVVANIPSSGTGSDFVGYWDIVVQGKTPPTSVYDVTQGSWFQTVSLTLPAGEVLGTIP